MRLTFLGVSSALTAGPKNYQSNMVLKSASGRHLLIDCGSDIRHSLFDVGLHHADIDAVYISHLHADHVGGLEWFGFSKRFIDQQKPKLYIAPKLQQPLWNHVLSGGMSTLETEEASLSVFFQVEPIENKRFVWEGYTFKLIEVFHSLSNHKRLPSYGLLIEGEHSKVFISTDTRFTPHELMPVYLEADLIFHDCEVQKIPSGQHALFTELETLDPKIKAKMWLYDYPLGALPDAEKAGFIGFVVRGQSFEI